MRSLRDSILNTFPNIPDLQRTHIDIYTLGELLDLGEKAEVLNIITNIENEYNFSMKNLAKSIQGMNASSQSTMSVDNLRTYIGLFTYTHESFQNNYKEDINIYLDFIKKLESAYGVGDVLAGDGYLLRAKLEALNNNYDTAITILEENNIKSREPLYFLTLGKYYHHQKKYAKAEENFNVVLKRNPINPKGHYYAALLYYDWGKKEKAREYLNKALEIWKNADENYMYSNMAKATAQAWKAEILN
jgi:tetratricopeptide (TPR) repeat protein